MLVQTSTFPADNIIVDECAVFVETNYIWIKR